MSGPRPSPLLTPAPEPAVGPPPGNPRFPLLDGARAIAALSVLVLHVGDGTRWSREGLLGAFVSRLDVGVAIFFVLSGFLLYRPFAAARVEGRGAPSVSRYLRRRLLRIVPAFWVGMIAMVALGWISLVGDWWRYFLFTQSYDSTSVFGGIRPAWSLCVEMAFYLVLPLWALGAARILAGRPRGRQLRLEAASLAVVAAGSLLLRALVFAHDNTSLFLISLPAQLDWFAAGMLLALASLAVEGAPPSPARCFGRAPAVAWASALALFLLVSLTFSLPRGLVAAPTLASHLAQHIIYCLVGLLLVLPGVFGVPDGASRASRAVVRTLGHPVLMWLGLVSYGMFLWHQPLLDALLRAGLPERTPALPFVTTLLATLVCTIALAAMSYYLVERPALRLKDRRRARLAAPAAEPDPTIAG